MISHALKYTNACNNNMSTQYDHTFVGGRGGRQGKGEWGTGPTADYFARPTGCYGPAYADNPRATAAKAVSQCVLAFG